MKGISRPIRRFSLLKYLLFVMLLLLPLTVANPLLTQTRPVHALPTLGEWHSLASTYGNTTIVTDPEKAFDQDEYSYAEFLIRDGYWFEIKGWDYSGGIIDHVDFTLTWEVIGTSDDEYRMLYLVDPSATETDLQSWQTGDQAKTTSTWSAFTEPNNGTWEEVDINNIRFRVDTRHNRGWDSATFRVWEARLTVYYTPPTVSIKPTSTVDSSIAPKTSTILRPDGDGAYTAWTGDYTDWDEAVQNGDTDYVSATAPYKTETSTFQDHTTEDWTIGGVKLVVWARMNETDANPEEVNLRLRIGTKIYKGPNYALTTTYEQYTTEWAVNPATGSNWTWADIDGLQAGVRSYASGTWTGEMRVTQIYLEVVGMRYQVKVRVDHVVNMWGWQFDLTYNGSILHGVNWEGTDPVFVDPFLSSAGATVLSAPGPGFNNTKGKLELTAAFQSVTDPLKLIDGSGNIASISFTVVGVGPTSLTLGPTCKHSGNPHDYDIILEGVHGEFIKVQLVNGSFDNTGAAPVPEFPLGAVAEIALVAVVVYFWWKTKSKRKPQKVTAHFKISKLSPLS